MEDVDTLGAFFLWQQITAWLHQLAGQRSLACPTLADDQQFGFIEVGDRCFL